ncbi:MAG: GNAT family N-acetyltransferase [Gemmatimonadaceae bacterium]
MRLALLRPEDRARVSELLIATAAFSSEEVAVALEIFDETFGESCRPDRSAATEGPALALPGYEFVGAFDEREHLLGYACFGPTPATEGTYDLYWLAVDPAAQGRGAGRALVQWVERELGGRAARLLVVETSSRADYEHTRAFYARGGYAEAARVRDFYAPADDRIILTTRLTTREGGVATR